MEWFSKTRTASESRSIPSSSGSERAARDDDTFVRGTNRALDKLSRKYFSRNRLDRALGRPQITAIAFAGTIGIGAFNTSGEMIGISGSLGCVLSYIIAGIIVIGVMRSLAEMVSVRPVEGALMDYPTQFVDRALGFAVGVLYWASECISTACLTAGAARVANNFAPDTALSKGTTGGIIVGLWFITLFSNICGIKIYGNLERVVSVIKFSTILVLCVLMIVVNVGVGGYPTEHKSKNYTEFSFPPGMKFDGFNTTTVSREQLRSTGISGSNGRFLAIWTTVQMAIFACQGGDLVIVAAGEARNPRKDLPPVTRFIYLVPIICYVMLSFLVGFNINYADPNLINPWQGGHPTRFPSHSPFIIVLSNTSLAPRVLPKVLDGLFLFAAYTAANTALYAASRTLYSLSQEYGPKWMSNTVGRTSRGHTPQIAIMVSCVVGFLAFLGLADTSFNQPVTSLAAFFTSGLACVYACECYAFMRFKQGLKYLEENGDVARGDNEYKRDFNYYCAHWQPLCAIVGLTGSLLVICFSGWPAIYLLVNRGKMNSSSLLKPDIDFAFDLLGAYLAPVIFAILYLGYKFYFQTKVVDLRDPRLRELYFLKIEEEPPRKLGRTGNLGWWVKELLSFLL